MAILAGGALLLASISIAAPKPDGPRPVISGTPIVGAVLTSSSAGETGRYRWQSCDPAVASCADAGFPDSNWTDLTGPSADPSYTVQPTDVGHFIRVLAKGTSLGTQFTPSEPVGPIPPTAVASVTPGEVPPTAQHGVTVLIVPFGSVEVKLPGKKCFAPVEGPATIPVGTVVDTRGSKVLLTAATGALGDTTPDQSVEFYGGLFRALQRSAANAPAVAKLVQKLACGKGQGSKGKASASSGPVAVTARKRRRRVWGSGSGSYGTAGSGGTGSVRGTTWLTKDNCKGTFFKVTEGIGITVFDRDLKKRVPLGPGQSYFAKNRPKKH
jgi:hypothetical protein